MLANKIQSSSTKISTRNLVQRFSKCLLSTNSPEDNDQEKEKKTKTDSKSKPTAPRDLPIRHSRHNPPQVASSEILEEASQRIIASTAGTLFCKFFLHARNNATS